MCVCVVLLIIVGVVELGGDFEDSVQNSCGIPRVSLLLLPLNIKIPKPIRVEIQTCCLNRTLKHTEAKGLKNIYNMETDIFNIFLTTQPFYLAQAWGQRSTGEIWECSSTYEFVGATRGGSCQVFPAADWYNGSTDLHLRGFPGGPEHTPDTTAA